MCDKDVILHIIKIEPSPIYGGCIITTKEGYKWKQLMEEKLGEYKTTKKFIDFLEGHN